MNAKAEQVAIEIMRYTHISDDPSDNDHYQVAAIIRAAYASVLEKKDARIATLEEALNAMDNALDMLMQDEPTLQVNMLLALKLVDARAKTRAALTQTQKEQTR